MIIDGRALALKLEQKLKEELLTMPRKKVAFLLFADTLATRQFVALKSKVAERLGIETRTFECFDHVTTEQAAARIGEISRNEYDGIVVQLPLPQDFDTEEVLNAVSVDKDLDVLGELSKDYYESSESKKIPPVARAVQAIFVEHAISPIGKNIVLVGNGRLVGEPVGLMLAKAGAIFSIVDEHTSDAEKTERFLSADIIISGAGVPHMIKPDMIKEGAVLIDAGTSEQAGKLVGDIDPLCESKASLMTPVPGGVGPLTVVSLFMNLI